SVGRSATPGRLWISEGKILYESAFSTGTMTLHEGDGKRVLVWEGTARNGRGAVRAEISQKQPQEGGAVYPARITRTSQRRRCLCDRPRADRRLRSAGAFSERVAQQRGNRVGMDLSTGRHGSLPGHDPASHMRRIEQARARLGIMAEQARLRHCQRRE